MGVRRCYFRPALPCLLPTRLSHTRCPPLPQLCRRKRYARQAWQRLIDAVRAGGPLRAPERLPSLSAPTSPVARQSPPPGGLSFRFGWGAQASAAAGQQPLLPSGPADVAAASGGAGPAGGSTPLDLEAPAPASSDSADLLEAMAAQLRRDLEGGGPGSAAASRTTSEAEGLAGLGAEAGTEDSSGAGLGGAALLAGAQAPAVSSPAAQPSAPAVQHTPRQAQSMPLQLRQPPPPQQQQEQLGADTGGSRGGGAALSESAPSSPAEPADLRSRLRPISSDEMERLGAEGVSVGAGTVRAAAHLALLAGQG